MSLPPGPTPGTSPGPGPADATALRAEHDVLAERLAVRESIRLARNGIYQVFGGLLAMGFAIALAWDRWGPLKPGFVRPVETRPPFFMYVAMLITSVAMAFAVRTLLRARREMAAEEALRHRFDELRRVLELDA